MTARVKAHQDEWQSESYFRNCDGCGKTIAFDKADAKFTKIDDGTGKNKKVDAEKVTCPDCGTVNIVNTVG